MIKMQKKSYVTVYSNNNYDDDNQNNNYYYDNEVEGEFIKLKIKKDEKKGRHLAPVEMGFKLNCFTDRCV